MNPATPDQTTDAILFFENGSVAKEMLLPEFEAVLDHVVAVSEYAEQDVRAALVRVNVHLDVTAAVFFRLKFNSKGVADASWNLPLDHMAAHSALGPDMGSGKIRLGCKSQCCVPWHQKQMWDPVMRPDNNSFAVIRRVIKQNSLGLPFRVKRAAPVSTPTPIVTAVKQPPAEIKAPRSKLEQTQRDRIALLIKQQRLHIATLNNQRKDEVQRVQQALQKKCASYVVQIEESNSALEAAALQVSDLQQSLAVQSREAEEAQKHYTQQLKQVEEGDADQLSMLHTQLERECKLKLETKTADLKEMLDMRDVELYYREEQMGTLREEIGNLRQERLRFLNQGPDNYLVRLREAGITFVTQQPGIGPITVPLEEIGGFLDCPEEYAAQQCFMEQDLYRQWLQHYKQPICRVDVGGGEQCSASLERLEKPNQFIVAYSDRCEQHREHSEPPTLSQSQ